MIFGNFWWLDFIKSIWGNVPLHVLVIVVGSTRGCSHFLCYIYHYFSCISGAALRLHQSPCGVWLLSVSMWFMAPVIGWFLSCDAIGLFPTSRLGFNYVYICVTRHCVARSPDDVTYWRNVRREEETLWRAASWSRRTGVRSSRPARFFML